MMVRRRNVLRAVFYAGSICVSVLSVGCSPQLVAPAPPFLKLHADFESLPVGAINVEAGCIGPGDPCALPGDPEGDEMVYRGGMVEISGPVGGRKLIIREKSTLNKKLYEDANGWLDFWPADHGGGGSTIFSWDADVSMDPASERKVQLEVHTIDIWYGRDDVCINAEFQGEGCVAIPGKVEGPHHVNLKIDRARSCYVLMITGPGVQGPDGLGSFFAKGSFSPPARIVEGPSGPEDYRDLNLSVTFSGSMDTAVGSSEYSIDEIRVTSTRPKAEDTPEGLDTPDC